MKCPHCTVTVHEAWSNNGIKRGLNATGFVVGVMQCPACNEEILRYRENNGDWHQFFPQGSSRGPVDPAVPPDIAADYKEAALVLPLSAKASAALSRRCLQAVLQNAGYTQRDLAQQIDAVLAEADARKAVPTGVHMTIDAVRNFGNFSAHRITDQTTLQVIDVEPHEAEHCLDILDAVFDHYYVRPAEAQRKKDELNKKLGSGGKPPAK